MSLDDSNCGRDVFCNQCAAVLFFIIIIVKIVHEVQHGYRPKVHIKNIYIYIE